MVRAFASGRPACTRICERRAVTIEGASGFLDALMGHGADQRWCGSTTTEPRVVMRIRNQS